MVLMSSREDMISDHEYEALPEPGANHRPAMSMAANHMRRSVSTGQVKPKCNNIDGEVVREAKVRNKNEALFIFGIDLLT